MEAQFATNTRNNEVEQADARFDVLTPRHPIGVFQNPFEKGQVRHLSADVLLHIEEEYTIRLMANGLRGEIGSLE